MFVKNAMAALLSLIPLALAAVEPARKSFQPVGNGDRLLKFNETSPAATIRPKTVSVAWSSVGGDGHYISKNEKGDLVLSDIVSNETEIFVAADDLPVDVHEYWISSDASQVLVASNYTKQYRYSYFADYFILDVKSGNTTALVDDQIGDIQYATLSPDGDSVAFVRGNNLYVRESDGEINQITKDGGPDMFHGVPDWVYEEEIFGTPSTLWFSPDSRFIAFLSFNETGVGTFTIPYYMNNGKLAPTYPRELDLRYPKVGSKNPTVELHILDVSSGKFETVPVDAFGPEELIIGEVAWVTGSHDALIYRAFNRVQDHDAHVTVNPTTLESKTVRERDGSDGWLDHSLAIAYVGQLDSSSNATYYVDLSDEDGWNHIYLYPVNGGDPVQLTSGEWEVSAVLYIDAERKLVYYQASTRHSTERHIYTVSFETKKITPLVDDDAPASWTASFSTKGGYYILTYQGPDVPYQELYNTNTTSKPIRTLEDNKAFIKTISEYKLPNVTYFELEHKNGYKMNVMQNLPANFDPSKKYPALFTPYGGPNSQRALKTFQALDWKMYIGSDPELDFITYTVDNRGTGHRGREYRNYLTSQLGKAEPLDQIWAAEELANKFDYINTDKVGIWGWSYGGYLAAKTLEADSEAFTFGLIVAPVTDWRFYDSMYTERFMKKLEHNEEGYNETAVHDVEGFKNAKGGFSILHGTGDDNVHYQHTAAMVDLLVGGGVSPEQMKMFAFTDSDHSIYYNGAGVYIYKYLTARLFDEVKRKPDAKRLAHQWSRRQVWAA